MGEGRIDLWANGSSNCGAKYWQDCPSGHRQSWTTAGLRIGYGRVKISCFASRGMESHLERVFSATSLKEEEIGSGQALGRSFSLQAHQTGESLHLLWRGEWGLQEDHCVKGAPTPGTGAAGSQQSSTLKAITAGVSYSSSLFSIPLTSALPLDHSNLGKREKLYCKKHWTGCQEPWILAGVHGWGTSALQAWISCSLCSSAVWGVGDVPLC